MDFMDLVKKRVSVREYSSEPIKREDINQCLEAARLAPSSCNSQPWKFIVVDKPEIKDKLCGACLSGIYGLNKFIKNAAAIVIVVTDRDKWLTKVCNFIKDTRLYLIDIGISCEHFVLRAAELGIGTCILGWFNENAVKKLLGIPKSNRICIIISMGYAAKEPITQEKNRKEISEMSLYL